ncbi:phage tail protein, partial [Acinetobacter baumannii]
MAEFYNVTTNLGDAEIANAIATNTKLDITHVSFGDGNGSVPTPTKTRTSLVREVHRQAVTKYERHATNANWIVIETIIPSDVGGFTIREMGIIANGKLISHGSHAPFYKVADSTGVSEYRLKFTIDIQDASVVQLTLDESLIYATQAWVNENYIPRADLIDNLTTADATKPLAAQQGKNLQDNKLDKTANAVSATKLATARTIGGVSFDGTANINLPGVNTAGNQNTTGNA